MYHGYEIKRDRNQCQRTHWYGYSIDLETDQIITLYYTLMSVWCVMIELAFFINSFIQSRGF